jgi:hypothetical protein
MIRARHGGLLLAAALALVSFAAGCNAIFGIREGEPAGGGGPGGSGGAGGSGASSAGGSGGSGVVCPPEKPGTCDGAYLSDADNCCLPGRSCQGGECVDGVCLSAPHGQTVQGSEAIAVVRSGDLVLWSGGNERAIYKSDEDGDGLGTLVGGGQHDLDFVTMIAADPDPSGYVFFTDYDGGRIGRASIETGQTVILAEVPAAIVPGAEARWGRILVHGDHVYWALDFQADDGAGQLGKHIWRAPREPADPLPVAAEMVVMTTGAFGIAADDEHLYFGNSDSGTIERLAFSDIGQKDGNGDPVLGPPEVLAGGQGLIGEIAVDDGNVYWAYEGEVRYQKKDQPMSSISSVFGLDSYVWGIVSDGRDIYISTVGGGAGLRGALWRAPVGGSVAELLHQTEAFPEYNPVYNVTADCDTVYFIVQQGGHVRRLTK